MKKRFFIVLALVCAILFCACSKYDDPVAEYLSNQSKYSAYQFTLMDVYYYDEDTGTKLTDFTTEDFAEQTVILKVGFNDFDSLAVFLDSIPNADASLEDYVYELEIIPVNNQILINNGFYNNIPLNEVIDVTAANLMYSDTNYFWVAELAHNGTTYLSYADGFSNIAEEVG